MRSPMPWVARPSPDRCVIIVIAGTSGLLAALDSAHAEHQASNEAIMAAVVRGHAVDCSLP